MCLICIEFQKQAMTTKEARRALGEMRAGIGIEHTAEVEKMIKETEHAADKD